MGCRVSIFAPIAIRSRLPSNFSQKLLPRMNDVIKPDPSAAMIPRTPDAAIAPRVGQKARQNPSVTARWTVRMLTGPRGRAAANPKNAEIRKRAVSDGYPDKML